MNHRPLCRPTPTPRRPVTDRPGRRLRRTVRRLAPAAAVATSTVVAVALVPDAAYAAESIEQVVTNIRTWLVGILVAVATLFLTVGGLRYAAANGDPGEVEKAKLALRSAAIGYGLALLAPLFVTIVGQWVA
ncbi:pilin [Actinoplanes sp. NPDC051861]|uniref:pilin n=1 Tax=Actinoplanes sp. NPDC051861 TaxID=3155170 RepID=UPI00343A0AC0